MKTQKLNDNLNFTKSSLVELNDQQMLAVNGGDAITISYVFKNGEKVLYITYANDR